jgi:uncharacterized protein
MPEYLSPGVYIEEIPGPRPIEGVSTTTTGFVGQTERGPSEPQLVTSWTAFLRWYGGPIQESFLPLAVKGFFDNGGKRAFIARVSPKDSAVAKIDVSNLLVSANGAGDWGNKLFIRIAESSNKIAGRFRLTVLYYAVKPDTFVDPFDKANLRDLNRREPDIVEDFDDLFVDPRQPNGVVDRINGASKLIRIKWKEGSSPEKPSDKAFEALQDGLPGAPATADDYIGDPLKSPDQRTGLTALAQINEISLLCAPDGVDKGIGTEINLAVIEQCELLRDRFAILSVSKDEGDVGKVIKIQDTKYGAVYYPWIRVFNPRGPGTQLVPPVGHIAGIYARSDIERGVHKAPANEVVRGIVNVDLPGNEKPLEYTLVKEEHDILNPKGVCVIRDFRSAGRGIRVWGARTMSSDAEWKYINVRRLFIFIEESIEQGTQYVVFEPNDEPTWAAVRRSITAFLTSVWRSGGLMGNTQEEAFFVRCDRTTMTQDDIDNGRLICQIGIAPSKPAEFVIFRFSQKTLELTN